MAQADTGPEKQPIWTTRDGRVLLMSQMTDQHLMNFIAMLRRKAQGAQDQAVLRGYLMLSWINGEMA